MHYALKSFIEDNHSYDHGVYLPIYQEYYDLLVAMRDHVRYGQKVKTLLAAQFKHSWSVFAPLYIWRFLTHMSI